MNKTISVSLFSFFVILACGQAHSQESANNMTPDEAIAVLKQGPDHWFGSCELVGSAPPALLSNQKVKTELVSLLERIAAAQDKVFSDPLYGSGKSKLSWTGDCEDECSECLSVLEKEVASWRDKRTLKLLVHLGSSYALDFGGEAYPLILNRYHSKSTHLQGRTDMIGLMSWMFERGIGTEDMRKEAKSLVFDAATKGDDIFLRDVAIHQLFRFGREDALMKLKEIAENDPSFYISKTSKEKRYPVREAAKYQIERLAKLGTRPEAAKGRAVKTPSPNFTVLKSTTVQ